MQTVTSDIIQIYKDIEASRKKYGSLKKCEFHLHTPASFDYRLIKGRKYQDLSVHEIIDFAVEQNYLNQEQKKILLEGLSRGDYDGVKYVEQLTEKQLPYENFKEYLSFMLIAHKLYSEDIEVVVVTDHNTISGYRKLKAAVDEYYKSRIKSINKDKKAIYVFLGVEISCSDENHVVGIFNEAKFNEVQKFLDKYIEKKGTIETSYTIIKEIHEMGGIAYIAHINTSKFIGTGVYKETLFNCKELKVLGLKNLEQRGWEPKFLAHSKRKLNDFCYLFEGDAHEISEIGINNTWVKFNEVSFATLKKAISNYKLCVYVKKPIPTDKYIKGIYIKSGENGFLSSSPTAKSHEVGKFHIDFSRDLNCIIGGRGTGKSTILNIIDTVLTQEAQTLNHLKFISNHEIIYILFSLNEDDYIVRFIPQSNTKVSMDHRDFFLEKAFKESVYNKEGNIELPDHWFQLFKIEKSGTHFNATEIRNHTKKREVLNKVYRKGFSINRILTKIDKGEIGQFVKDIIFYGLKTNFYDDFLSKLKNIQPRSLNRFLRENIPKIMQLFSDQQKLVNETIDSFNNSHRDLIQIQFSPKEKEVDYYLDELWFNVNKRGSVANTRLTWEDVERYTYKIVEKIGLLCFLRYLTKKKYSELERVIAISTFISNRNKTIKDVEEEYEEVSARTLKNIYNEIQSTLLRNKSNVMACLQKYFEIIDDFTLMFNVNSKELIRPEKPLFKNIENLSLGQKVVAILTFIIEYGKHIGDNTPLVIDQPEDNLDNQYIYKNLVASLRTVKNTRQVIIVTHNSTIVTNADAEQVVVLESDGNHGWVKQKGYLSDKRIMRYILLHLEGGEESFKHKMENYSLILNL